jgi:hypothetical protein
MDQLLTVIVQTSPIPSHPSTALLEALFRSFRRVDGLLESRILIVCDGCEQQADDSQEAENMKHGKVSSTTASRYEEHRKRLTDRLNLNQPPFCSVQEGSIELVELHERHGSARAIEAAFLSQVKTPFVMIAQHDNFFVKDVPLRSVLLAMKTNVWAKAIHFPATATLNYQQKVQKRYGITIQERRMDDSCFKLVPLVFWYGRTHVARSDYYRDFVLKNRTLRVGDHLEELLGETQLRDILQNGMSAHEPYGNYVLHSNSQEGNNNNSNNKEEEVLYHLSGRRAVEEVVVEQDNHTNPGTSSDNSNLVDPKNDRRKILLTDNHHHHHHDTTAVGNNSFTTARSCRAVVPGLSLPPLPTTTRTSAPKGRFKQKCFHCGVKGHSFKFCPDRSLRPETETIDLT